jgi:putative hydrolase of the HAD superfamily
MPKSHFTHIRDWVFDLDNTLYPPSANLFAQIETKMTDYVMRVTGVDEPTASHLRQSYWADYGTTLAGLMRHHDIDPETYLHEVHDISFAPLDPDPELAALIKALPGRKIVYTNGSAPYAQQVLQARGLAGLFDAVYGVEHADYAPKPERSAFETVFGKDGLDPNTAAMFEDDSRNLEVPHALGMRTVHVAAEEIKRDFIHFHTSSLVEFLRKLAP